MVAGFGAPGGAAEVEDVGVLPPVVGTTVLAAEVVSADFRSLPFSVVDDGGGGAAAPLEPFDTDDE